MTCWGYEDGQPLEIALGEALGIIADSQNVARQLRLLDAAGEEIATLRGMLAGPAWVAGRAEQVAELQISRGGLSAMVKTPEDGTMTGILPSGAKWITTPLPAEEEAAWSPLPSSPECSYSPVASFPSLLFGEL